ncbi:hypothetical protein ACNKHM_22765 [Shigella sonnei]
MTGKAPRIFAKLSRGGVPRNALYVMTARLPVCASDLHVWDQNGTTVAAEHLRDDGFYRLAGDRH